jgi:protoporphyrinogen oxidase
MYAKFGRGITEKYLRPYNEKVWKTRAEDMGIDWVEGRVPDPPLEDVLKASLGIPTEGYTHQLHFLYPRDGGVQALTDALAPKVRAVTGFAVTSVRRAGGRWVVSDGGEERTYDRLVSTIPIPDLVRALEGVPSEVRDAAGALVHRSLYTVMLGVDREDLNDLHWLYFPRPEDGLFNRASFPANYSDRVCPPGASSVLAEITCTVGDEVWQMPPEAVVEHVTAKLDEAGLIDRREVFFSRTCRTPHAYVIFDRGHRRNLDLVNAFTARLGIESVGRFGQFDYINTDQCILRALELAVRFGA